MVNTYIAYAVNLWSYTQGADFTSGNSFFGAVKLTKIADPDKYFYSGHGAGFDARGSFPSSDDSAFNKNVIRFSADMRSFVHIDNKKKDILVLINGPTDGLDDTTLTAEKERYRALLSNRRNFV